MYLPYEERVWWFRYQKKAKGVCKVDNFRGVSLSSMVCEVMCVILNNRLLGVAEEEGLIADEQEGSKSREGVETRYCCWCWWDRWKC